MKRRLFIILSAVSLLLCIAFAFGWLRSEFAGESITCDPFHPSPTVVTGYGIASGKGVIGIQSYRYTFTGSVPDDVLSAASVYSSVSFSINHNTTDPTSPAFIPHPSNWNRWGFLRYKHVGQGIFPGNVAMTNELWFVGIPYWLPLLLTSPLGLLCILNLWTRWRQIRRVRFGLCTTCGYDLRASAERCPECGTLIPADLVRKPVA